MPLRTRQRLLTENHPAISHPVRLQRMGVPNRKSASMQLAPGAFSAGHIVYKGLPYENTKGRQVRVLTGIVCQEVVTPGHTRLTRVLEGLIPRHTRCIRAI